MGNSILFAIEVWFLAFVIATVMASVIKLILIVIQKSAPKKEVPVKEGGEVSS
jgi:acid phosphatase family membrane protein YuiD